MFSYIPSFSNHRELK